MSEGNGENLYVDIKDPREPEVVVKLPARVGDIMGPDGANHNVDALWCRYDRNVFCGERERPEQSQIVRIGCARCLSVQTRKMIMVQADQMHQIIVMLNEQQNAEIKKKLGNLRGGA